MACDVTLTLRPAARADCELLFQWRNHERVRTHSLNPEPVDWESHQAWYTAALMNPARIILIGEAHDAPVGVLRYDVSGNEAVVSVYLAPNRMGQGHGSRLLQNGIQWIKGTRPDVLRLKAEILSDNPASIKAFEKAGYRRITGTQGVTEGKYQIELPSQAFRQVLHYEYIIESA